MGQLADRNWHKILLLFHINKNIKRKKTSVDLYVDCELVAKKKIPLKKLHLLFPQSKGKSVRHVFRLAYGGGSRSWKVREFKQ